MSTTPWTTASFLRLRLLLLLLLLLLSSFIPPALLLLRLLLLCFGMGCVVGCGLFLLLSSGTGSSFEVVRGIGCGVVVGVGFDIGCGVVCVTGCSVVCAAGRGAVGVPRPWLVQSSNICLKYSPIHDPPYPPLMSEHS